MSLPISILISGKRDPYLYSQGDEIVLITNAGGIVFVENEKSDFSDSFSRARCQWSGNSYKRRMELISSYRGCEAGVALITNNQVIIYVQNAESAGNVDSVEALISAQEIANAGLKKQLRKQKPLIAVRQRRMSSEKRLNGLYITGPLSQGSSQNKAVPLLLFRFALIPFCKAVHLALRSRA